MITEKHKWAIKIVKDNEVEIFMDVVYESAIDQPSNLIGFATEAELILYLANSNLIEYVPPVELDFLCLN